MTFEENPQQLVVRHLGRIKSDLDRFRMTRDACTHTCIGWKRILSSTVPHNCIFHPCRRFKQRLR